jgi:hypothetical protein
MRSLLLTFTVCLFLAGCYGPPSSEELSRLDYGTPPSTEYEETAATDHVSRAAQIRIRNGRN